MKWNLKKTNYPDDLPKQYWVGKLPDGQLVTWKGFTSGPLTLTESEREALCQKLLQADGKSLKMLATDVLQPISGAIDKSLILHSTTTDLGAFKGDLAKLLAGKQAKNYAGYTETRSVFLGKPGDLAVGRMLPWKVAAAAAGLDRVEIPGLDYYYLSDALLKLAAAHLEKPAESIRHIVDFLKQYPHAVVRLYVLDKAMQIFLVWLKRQAGLEKIYIDANSPEVSEIWNRKNILYPAVKAAREMNQSDENTAHQTLAAERKQTLLYQKLGLTLPGLPGYTIRRSDTSLPDFTRQMLEAAQFLQHRYGLKKGCLKAGDAGDGARIIPNIDLDNENHLTNLAHAAYEYGDDYVLESHVWYATTTVGKQVLKLTPSAHIRAGKLAPGITLQFTEGTSWVGNIFINEQLAPEVGISVEQYHSIRTTMADFLAAFEKQNLGLTIAGIDFAIGQVGGGFGKDILLGIQDPNISFNGAEFLRGFMTKISEKSGLPEDDFFATTWVFVPTKECTHSLLSDTLRKEQTENIYTMVIAVVPGCWAMIGVAGSEYQPIIKHLEHLQGCFDQLHLSIGKESLSDWPTSASGLK